MKGMKLDSKYIEGMKVDAIAKALEHATEQMIKEAEIVAGETAAEMERYAKENKRWEYQTGHAEDCLIGSFTVSHHGISAEIRQDMFGISGKEYGYYLETAKRFKGKYAILQETRNLHADMFFSGLQKALHTTIERI